jgi:hypothetical protein
MLQCSVKRETRIPGLTTGFEMQECVRQAQNRLHTWIERFNNLSEETNKMKDQIELLRKERGIVLSIQAKLEVECEKNETEINILIERSRASHAAREYSLHQLKQLRAASEREDGEYRTRLLELMDLLDTDRKAHELTDAQQVVPQASPLSANIATVNDDNSISDEARRNRSDLLTSLFTDIQRSTGMTSVGDVLDYFHSKELENASLFMKVSLNASEIERISAKNNHTTNEIAIVRKSLVGGSSRSSREVPDSSRSALMSIKKKVDEVTSQINQLSKVVDSVESLTGSIFASLFTPPALALKYLPSDIIASSNGASGTPIGTITEHNVTGYLAAVEGRVDVIIRSMK